MTSREELRKTGPIEADVQHVIGALVDVEELEQAAEKWPDAQEIVDRAGDAASELDALRSAIEDWFERHPE